VKAPASFLWQNEFGQTMGTLKLRLMGDWPPPDATNAAMMPTWSTVVVAMEVDCFSSVPSKHH
jgi:hypothetical protein